MTRGSFLFVLCAAFLAAPVPGAGQNASESSLEGAETPSSDSGLSETGMTALIRQALKDPNAPRSWAGLAQGLSNLDAAGGRERPDVSAAVRIADSLAFSPLLAGSPRGETAPRGWIAGLLNRVSTILPRVGPFLPYAAAALVLAALVLNGWIPGRTARGGGGRAPKARLSRGRSPAPRRGSSGRGKEGDSRSLALSLMEHGMPANEVARRTGLAQDEVAVVLALHRQRQQAVPGDHPLPRSA